MHRRAPLGGSHEKNDSASAAFLRSVFGFRVINLHTSVGPCRSGARHEEGGGAARVLPRLCGHIAVHEDRGRGLLRPARHALAAHVIRQDQHHPRRIGPVPAARQSQRLHRRFFGRGPVERRQVRQGADGRDQRLAGRTGLEQRGRGNGGDGGDRPVTVPPRPGRQVQPQDGPERPGQVRRLRDLQREPERSRHPSVGALGPRDGPRFPAGGTPASEQLQQCLRVDGRELAGPDRTVREGIQRGLPGLAAAIQVPADRMR